MARCKRNADIDTARRGGRDQACSDRTKTASPLHRVSRDISVHVRFGSLADIARRIQDVRFTPESGHAQRPHQYPLVPIADIDNGNQRNLLVLIGDH
jgi:hypothetical protein